MRQFFSHFEASMFHKPDVQDELHVLGAELVYM